MAYKKPHTNFQLTLTNPDGDDFYHALTGAEEILSRCPDCGADVVLSFSELLALAACVDGFNLYENRICCDRCSARYRKRVLTSDN